MNEKPLVSVGVTTFNRPEGLKRSLDCLTQQTYPELEIIVSDNCSDGSTTSEVIRSYVKKDRRIQYFHQEENLGAGGNFKFVLSKARGNYFMWWSDDDIWEKEFIEEGVRCLSDPKISAWISDVSVINKAGQVTRHFPSFKRFEKSEKTSKFVIKYLLEPECMGKPSIIHSLFKIEDLTDVLNEYDVTSKSLAAADVCFNLAFLIKYNLKTTQKTLFYKNSNSERKVDAPKPLKHPSLYMFRFKNSLKYIREVYLATKGSGFCFISVLVMTLRVPLALRNEIFIKAKSLSKTFRKIVLN